MSRYDRFIRDPAWQVITSTAYDQEALDLLGGNLLGGNVLGMREKPHPDTASTHSPFAQALFAGLAGAADLIPRDDPDGVITTAELALYLRDWVERNTAHKTRQVPGSWSLRRDYDKGEYIFLVPGKAAPDLPPAPDLTAANNPYKGLSAYRFNPTDARLFFGREEMERALIDKIETQPLTVVLGASGTGKSSLVNAGVLPRLQGWRHQDEPNVAKAQSAAPSAPQWTILPPMRPSATPLRALAGLLHHELDVRPTSSMPYSTQAIREVIEVWAQAHRARTLLLVVDQFEEMITLCHSAQERADFLRLLAELTTHHADQLRLVVTLRSDFAPQFEDSLPADLWTAAARFIVTPMDQDDLRRAIQRPAAERVLYFDPPELVDDLINEVIQTPGALPLLSFTLSELYVKYVESGSDNRALTRRHFEELGGVIGSLRVRAEEEYAALPDDGHRATMQRILLRMVAVEGAELARRRVARTELIYADVAENDRVTEVLQRLIAARLLVTGRDEAGDEYVEPAHDALVHGWARLLQWKQAAEVYLPLQRRVHQAAEDWSAAGEPANLLWNGNAFLPQLQAELTSQPQGQTLRSLLWPRTDGLRRDTWLNRLEATFVRRSIEHQARLNRRITAVTLAVIAILSAITLFALDQQATARRNEATAVAERNTAVSQRLAAESQLRLDANDYDLGLLLAIEAGTNADTQDAFGALRRVLDWPAQVEVELVGHGPNLSLPSNSSVLGAHFNQDASRVLTYSTDDTARVWDARTGDELFVLAHDESLISADWDAGEQRIVTTSQDRTLRIWDATDGAPIAVSQEDTGWIRDLHWSADGRRILTAADDMTASVWDAQTGARLAHLVGHEHILNTARWNRSEDRILTTSADQTARLWDAQTGDLLLSLGDTNAGDATTLGAVRLWQVDTGEELMRLSDTSDSAQLSAMAWHPDGRRFLTISEDFQTRQYFAYVDDLLLEACRRAPRSLTDAEWRRYRGAVPYQDTCATLQPE
ncbi:MAG: WD40 repeat domain-containing protein [Caldilineaceae bacterium]|nr:WD40 repeat domain-containing protein [Caldilineaceae bacterium]